VNWYGYCCCSIVLNITHNDGYEIGVLDGVGVNVGVTVGVVVGCITPQIVDAVKSL